MQFRRTNSAVLIMVIACQALAFMLAQLHAHGSLSTAQLTHWHGGSLTADACGDAGETLASLTFASSLTSATSPYLLEGKRHNDPAKSKPPGRSWDGNSTVDVASAADVLLVRQVTNCVVAHIKKGFWLIYCTLLR